MRRLALGAILLLGCKSSWFAESKKAHAEATAVGKEFDIFDDSGGNPVKGFRPLASRRAKVTVTAPARSKGASSSSLSINVEASVKGPGERKDWMGIELTMPDGKKEKKTDSVGSPLFFCPAAPAECKATYDVELIYHGTGGTGHVSWKVTATSTNYDQANAPPDPVAPTIELELGREKAKP